MVHDIVTKRTPLHAAGIVHFPMYLIITVFHSCQWTCGMCPNHVT